MPQESADPTRGFAVTDLNGMQEVRGSSPLSSIVASRQSSRRAEQVVRIEPLAYARDRLAPLKYSRQDSNLHALTP